MASPAPSKSQPLHNFALLRNLKWNEDGESGGGGRHQRRRSIKSPSRRPNASSESPVRHSPLRDSVSAGKHPSPHTSFPVRDWAKHSVSDDPPPHFRRHDSSPESIDYQRIRQKMDGSSSIAASSINPEKIPQKSDAKSKGKEVEASAIKKSKILIKIPCKSSTKPEEIPIPIPAPEIENKAEADENIDEETKIWKLRPRKPTIADKGDPVRNNGSEKNKIQPKSGENSRKKGGGGEKKEKKTVSVFSSLSKEDIEEDIFSLTGAKPARRPKKRPKIVQKRVDTLFPGTWLVSISADSYRVSENSLKG